MSVHRLPGGREVVTGVDPDEHLPFLLMCAQRARDEGDLKAERLHMKQAVYVAATRGLAGLEPADLARTLRMGDDL